jgi:ankyrin repeat protein
MKETGRRTLIWLAKSFMPMSVDGLCETLALQPTNEVNDDSASERHSLIPTADEIVKCCKSLATIGYGSTTLVLVDAEIAEHLEFHWKEEYSIERTRLAQVCLKYLMSDTSLRGVCDRPETLSERLRSYSFLNYAASCWSKHALEAEHETRDLAVRFLSHKYYRESALQIYLSNENPRKLSFEVIRNVASSMSALQVATRAGLTECIDSLLESTEENNLLSADTEGRTVFHEAMETGNTRTFFKLLGIILDEYSKRIQEDPTYCRPLPNTFGFEDQDPFFKYALSHGYDYLSHGLKISALKIAIKRNNFTALVALLSLRSSDWSPEAKSISLHLAVHHGFTDLVAVILQYGAEINPKPPTQPVLLKAIALGSKPMVDLLVLYGADVNVQWEGQTPLLEAIEKKHFRIIKVLLEWNADIRALNADQKGVLHVAAASRNLDLVELLLHFGADVSHRDLDGKTALFVAVENGDQDIATLLLEYGVDSMAKSSTTGQTVLHEAVKRGDKHMVFLLLDHCGSFTSSDWQDSDGRTPLEVARLEHNDELARILEEDL